MRPKSSGIVLVRTTVPGMPESRWMNQEYALLPMSRLTRKLMGTMVEKRTRAQLGSQGPARLVKSEDSVCLGVGLIVSPPALDVVVVR
ncbi:hypothetical protein HYQ46_011057 [Verticillium longisporum]|nr:hypothetical protein HYQ46_011057 [Verticillium longisporum]